MPVQGCILPYLLPLNQTDTIAYNAVFTHLAEEDIAAEVVRSSAMDNRSDNRPGEPQKSAIKKLSFARNDIGAVVNY